MYRTETSSGLRRNVRTSSNQRQQRKGSLYLVPAKESLCPLCCLLLADKYHRARNRQHTGARGFPLTVKQSAATQRSVTADRELLQNDCLLLLHHGTAGYVAACGV